MTTALLSATTEHVQRGFWEGKRVLVTGAAGFIGSHLTELLLAEGAIVSGVSRSEGAFPTNTRVKMLTGDLSDSQFCQRAVEGQDVLMHLAASVGGIHYNMQHPASLFTDNLLPFINTLEAARLAQTPLFLTCSSACVYPRHCSIPTPEEEGFKDFPEPTNEGYGMAKRMQEYLSMKYSEQYGMNIAIARPYNAYGPRDDFDPRTSHVIAGLIHRLFQGEDPFVVWGSGNQSRAFLYVQDFARGLMLTAEKFAVAEPVNIGTNEEVSIKHLVDVILAVTGKTPEVIFDTSHPEGQPRRNCDTKKMQRVLGWEPEIALEEGIRRTVDWYRANC
jgi:GDP-L-fucose synthase